MGKTEDPLSGAIYRTDEEFRAAELLEKQENGPEPLSERERAELEELQAEWYRTHDSYASRMGPYLT